MEWSKLAEKRFEEAPTKAVVNFKKLQGALVALAFGYAVSIVVLVYEIIHWKYVILRDPAYDKYHVTEFFRQKKEKTNKYLGKLKHSLKSST